MMNEINSRQYTLINLFEKEYDEQATESALPLSKIEIPIIQRDYAQGRDLPEVKHIRERFLRALFVALTENKPITLDFIYGEIDANHTLIPLDGQQRLTTLFLLHWYIARHEGVSEDKLEFLSKFSYATRYSAREFCRLLTSANYKPDFTCKHLSDDIVDQSWMPLNWENDATISSMLRVIDDIHSIFCTSSGLWQRLEEGCISFYFLPIEQLGATDELYIKMNSRGKPLTEFENFKAEWEACIKAIQPTLTTEGTSEGVNKLLHTIEQKVDLTWTDLLWPYRNGGTGTTADDVIDDKFVRYFRFLTDLIYYKENAVKPSSNDILDIVSDLFRTDSKQTIDHLKFIEDGFDCWVGVDIDHLFQTFLTTEDAPGDSSKCIVAGPTNVFNQACQNYGEMNGRNRCFTIGRTVLLYAFLYYLQHKTEITEADFARRIRIITNLIKQSEYELREDNLPALLRQTEHILDHGDIENGYLNFNTNQLAEEHEKVAWVKAHPDKASMLYKLENHPLLRGAIRVVGLDHIDFTDRFYSLFACDWRLVNQALLSIGDYSLLVKWRFQIGSAGAASSWQAIFSTSQADIKEKNRILTTLLSQSSHFTDDVLKGIIDHYLGTTREYDWRHYLIKYASMRPEHYGMYFWENDPLHQKVNYNILMMWTEKSMGGRNYNVFLKTLRDLLQQTYPELNISLGEYAYSGDGNVLKLIFAEKYLFFTNDKIRICHQETDEKGNDCEVIDQEESIPQNEQGIDLADRVQLAFDIIKSYIKD